MTRDPSASGDDAEGRGIIKRSDAEPPMPQHYRLSRALLIPTLTAGVALGAMCRSVAGPPFGPNLDRGTWGGDNAAAIVTDSQAHVHIGCTFGDIPGLVPLSSDGSFSVAGSYVLRAYPITVGPSLPARFDGRVQRRIGISTLTLTVVVNDTVEKKTQTLGPVTVTFGREPSMGPCPICRVPHGPKPSASTRGSDSPALHVPTGEPTRAPRYSES